MLTFTVPVPHDTAYVVTFTDPDEDGYRNATVETFEGVYIVSPNADLPRLARDLTYAATDYRADFGGEVDLSVFYGIEVCA